MTPARKWYDTPTYNWVGALVSLVMLVLYIQRLMGPEPRPSTPYTAVIWALMFVTWLASAIRNTWFRPA